MINSSTDNVKLLNLLTKYVHKAFDLRNNYVNNHVRSYEIKIAPFNHHVYTKVHKKHMWASG